jgi:hypothetical protein
VLNQGRPVIEAECLIFRWVEINLISEGDNPHDLTTTSKPEAPMQSLNQLLVVTDLVGARSVWSWRSIPTCNRRTNKNLRRAILIISRRWSSESQRSARICVWSSVAKARCKTKLKFGKQRGI